MGEIADKNCLSYWFPPISAAGLPVPKTILIHTNLELSQVLDGHTPDGFQDFCNQLTLACQQVGLPAFIRTGHGSGKHEWSRTCFLADPKEIGNHICALVEWSNTVDLMGLPTEVWAVREMIPTMPAFRAFCGMPIVREFRVFTCDGKVTCLHPYWPPDSIRAATCPNWRERLADMSTLDPPETSRLKRLATEAAGAIDAGSWSVDFLAGADRQWWLIDMAEARRSFHWPGCDRTERT